MKCPHCSAKVGIFSKKMNLSGKRKLCPHCSNEVTFGLIQTRFALAFFPIAIMAIVLGLSGPIAAGIAGGIGAAYGMGLKRADA